MQQQQQIFVSAGPFSTLLSHTFFCLFFFFFCEKNVQKWQKWPAGEKSVKGWVRLGGMDVGGLQAVAVL